MECKVVYADRPVTGWQAKYVFEIDRLIKQAGKSLETALSIHPDLERYVVCFPFNLTGPTARKGKSQTEKFDEWARRAEADANARGTTLTVERWSAHDIQNLLLKNDLSGGLRHYFFSETTLSEQWFAEHISAAMSSAGPRYSPEVSLETPLSGWFTSFGEGSNWKTQLTNKVEICRKQSAHLREMIEDSGGHSVYSAWPEALYEQGQKISANSVSCIESAEELASAPTEKGLSNLQVAIEHLVDDLDGIDHQLAEDLDAKHGEGMADSKQFRSYMAEYNCSFPAANLDTVREARQQWHTFSDWLSSPEGFLAFKQVFVLSGRGGSGKTHSLCDIAQRRLSDGAYTCLVFGHQFNGEPDPWTRFIESLGVPLTLGRDGILDALDAAAEHSGKKLLVCIDAVNETNPRVYWLTRFSEFADAITRRAHLKLCVSCRTSFLPISLPNRFVDQAIEHLGFAGMEREACNSFFLYYDLAPPLVPVLQPELANPLYLTLVCQTLKARALKELPAGWFGIAPVIRAFLAHKEEQFATEHAVSVGASIVSGALIAVASSIARRGSTTLCWSDAESAIHAVKPQAKGMRVLQWLVTADLLIEDGPATEAIGAESVIRPAFERFGDFLVASEMLKTITSSKFKEAFQRGGQCAQLVSTVQAVHENRGLLSALSVLLPEKLRDVELSDLIDNEPIRGEVTKIVVQSLHQRAVETFSPATQRMLREALSKYDAYSAMDAILAVSTQVSEIDAYWLHQTLGWLSLAERDAFWCGYLKRGFEKNSIVRRLIDAAQRIELRDVKENTAERWCMVLLWFTAAADRRVKDSATRATIAILRYHAVLVVKLVRTLLFIDDDAVRERTLLVAYGVLTHSRNEAVLKELADHLLHTYSARSADFQNAIIRDHIRCIAELATKHGCLDDKLDPTLTTQRNHNKVLCPVPPTEEEVEGLDEGKEHGVSLLLRSCLNDDFNHYSINCLDPWNHAMPKPAIGRWIAKRVLDDFGYRGSNCSGYDSKVTQETGGGRGKPAWAERIGKKYQWIAMYQLASRLHDSVDRQKDLFTRTTGCLPLILQEERKLDPTISWPKSTEDSPVECWWVGNNVDLAATKKLDYAEWIDCRDDLPSMASLLAPLHHEDQSWLTLACYPTWSEYDIDRPYSEPWRLTRIDVKGFLVSEAQFDAAVRSLSDRNFFGGWMPSGARWLHTFVGEYPWATACNVETDDWLGFGTKARGSSVELIPVHNEIVCEWEYDASLPATVDFHVPARRFFEADQLRWNGRNGFSKPDGKTVFCDPSALEGGPPALLADTNDLLSHLEKLGVRVIWTLLGEKLVLNEAPGDMNRVSFSQNAHLNKDGGITIGDRAFFDNYSSSQGPAK
ncbi:hypothetical protein SADO_13433 [Salinisphaera dokdonensis CL-ES53]|uniref:ATP-binding protein n=1 Tax=Salinisphaera dokdonensis CL-ES53 TaxID=1304272 RepID=A0ABV2B2Z6_9GAMM